jgi:hypothetical protein
MKIKIFSFINDGGDSSYIYKDPLPTEGKINWRCIKIDDTLDFNLSGILISILKPLAESGVSVLVTSSFDTDYIYFKDKDFVLSMMALKNAGFKCD